MVQHHAVSRAGKPPKASGDHMFWVGVGGGGGEGGGGDMGDTISCVSNQHPAQQSPELVKATAPLTAH